MWNCWAGEAKELKYIAIAEAAGVVEEEPTRSYKSCGFDVELKGWQ